MSSFDDALDYTFQNEGGFSNDANDHGGATKYGITRAEASRWFKKPISIQEMKDLSADTAKSIYKAWYWDSMSLDKVGSPQVACAMFDIGVVMGIGVPPKFAQQICNAHGANLIVDGHIGALTLAAVNNLSTAVFIRDFSSKTENRFRGIVAANPSQSVFLRGWLNRAHRLLTLIQA